ncbi:hypothetical protein J2Y60_004620 [Arcicella sp. BE140]|nr:hypothetical protein [Arcicella sp. BE51]MDR6814402.1 hypothetical protein [Arcicella sp. BE140]MDR6825844.1 hypothetical protein [Arcicella sp. BE139]
MKNPNIVFCVPQTTVEAKISVSNQRKYAGNITRLACWK